MKLFNYFRKTRSPEDSSGEELFITPEILEQFEQVRRLLKHRAEELRLQEVIKDLDAQRTDWERRSALFVPSKRRLERGGKALELGEDYEAIKDLRVLRDKSKIKQASLRDEMQIARTELQNADEALTLLEAEYRDKLTEQTKLNNLVKKVKVLDEQIIDRQEAAVQAHDEYDSAERELRECSVSVEKEQISLEKVEVALREARKFLQLHSIDEKLQAGLPGIQKCFNMYEAAEEKRIALKSSLSSAISRKQHAQSVLNDRAALYSDVNHRFAVIEKNYVRARSFYESTLKGKTIAEWREVCEQSVTRLSELDELYKKFQNVKDLEDQLKNLQDIKLRIQQETRSLNIRDIEQAGKINELQAEAAKLEKRVALLHRIEDLDAVRELLQDGVACPLCGSMTHPYVSGAVIPDTEEVHRQLQETQSKLDELRNELTTRQTRAGKLGEEISSIGRDEADLRKKINELNAEISTKISQLDLKLGAGISPFEELDRARQKTRDKLQLARNSAETAEAAERDMKAAADELAKIKETREEVTRYHQDALFELQNEKTEQESFDSESKSQEEIVNSLKRELLAQIMPYGYKTVPDKNPKEIIEALEQRMDAWIENSKRRDELERELSKLNAKMTSLKKTREALKVKREEALSRVKAVEAERDSVQQQRIILFASKIPEDEQARMSESVESLRSQLNERRDIKAEKSKKLDAVLTSLHSLETEMATGREDLQRHEINFGKRLLALGFKNEDDYAAALLTTDERRDLQNKLRELTQTDLDINAERENTRAKILELQTDDMNVNDDELLASINELHDVISKYQPENEALREKINLELVPEIKKLMLQCGLPEVF